VFDKGGNEIAEGQVGAEPVELPQGIYRVVVNSATPRTFDNVQVRGEDELVLEID
jgi:hypothetical protein